MTKQERQELVAHIDELERIVKRNRREWKCTHLEDRMDASEARLDEVEDDIDDLATILLAAFERLQKTP